MLWIVIVVGVMLLIPLAAAVFSAKTNQSLNTQFPAIGRITPVNGGEIHWHEQGSGPVVVLIHGLSGNLQNFTALAKTLATRYRVISVDRPGSGYSLRMRGTTADFDTQADMLNEWMDKIGITHVLLVGHSMGGAIALNLATRYPHVCRAIALLCPLVAPVDKPPGPLGKLYIPNPLLRYFITHTFSTPVRMRTSTEIMTAIFAPDPTPVDFATTYGGAHSMHTRSFAGAAADILTSQPSINKQYLQYHMIKVPVGIAYGADDAILDPATHMNALKSELPSSVHHLIPNRGHMIPITAVDQCVALIDDMEQRASTGPTNGL